MNNDARGATVYAELAGDSTGSTASTRCASSLSSTRSRPSPRLSARATTAIVRIAPPRYERTDSLAGVLLSAESEHASLERRDACKGR